MHSSLEAQVDSPTWHLVQALNTLVEKDGHTPAVEGFFDKAKPLAAAQVQLIREHAAKTAENTVKQQLGVQHWVHDKNWVDSLILLESQPTINIEGLVAGYTGPGGKTVLPHKAVAKIDMRLVPDMTAADTLAKLKAHLAKHGFADIEVNMSGGYNPNTTDQRQQIDSNAARDLSKTRGRTAALAALGGIMAGICVHRSALEFAGGAFRTRPRHRRARSRRILSDRVDQPESSGIGRGSRILRRVSIRDGLRLMRG